MEDQDEFLMRKLEHEELHVGLETNNWAMLEDVGQNADMYIANQEGNRQHANLELRRLASAEL